MRDVRRDGRLEAGKRVGPYRVESVLGHGQMGVVYRARREDGTLVALKILRGELADDDGYRRRFGREGEIASALDHPNLVPVLDAGEESGFVFQVSPYLPGGPLSRRLEQGALAVPELVGVVADLGAALDALHRHALVHRDVKPANVLLADDGHALLTDFGLARGEAHTVLTAAGRVVGTADYLAPEVIQGERAGPPADIYSLGCLAYECAVGHAPFADRRSLGELCLAHLQDDPREPGSLRDDLPPPLSAALVTALAKDPARRPRTGAAYARLLFAGARGT